jgi:predicted RNase H-like HicB family nuclease
MEERIHLVNIMVEKYQVLVEEGLDGFFIAEVPQLPGCYSQGKTVEELMENIKEAIEVYLDTQKELDQKPRKRFFAVKEVVVNA